MNHRYEKFILVGMLGAFIAVVFAVVWQKYMIFGFNALDLAIYNNVFWNTVHGHWFASSIHPASYLGDHAEWLILALAPLYALLPHPLTLVMLKTAALATGALPIYWIARKKFGNDRMALLFPALWLMSPFVWNLALLEFNMIDTVAPLTLFAAWFYINRRWGSFIASTIAILLVREDAAFIVIGFGLLAIIDLAIKREKILQHLKRAIIPIVFAILVFIIDQKIIQHFNPDGVYKYIVYYQWLGNTVPQIVANAASHPWIVIAHVFKPWNLGVIVTLLLPVLFLPLLRPRWLIISAVVLAQYLATQKGMDAGTIKAQYSAPFLGAVFLATIDGFAAARDNKQLARIMPKKILPALLTIATIYCWIFIGSGSSLAKLWQNTDVSVQAANEALSLIPSNASVVSSMNTATQLSGRQNVWPLNYIWLGKKQFGTSDYVLPIKPEYLFIDENDLIYFSAHYPLAEWSREYSKQGDNNLRALIASGSYGSIYKKNGITLLKKGMGGTWPFVSVANKDAPISNPADQAIGPFIFRGWERGNELKLFFSAGEKISGEFALRVNGAYRAIGNGIYPPPEWKSNEIIAIPLDVADGPITIDIVPIVSADLDGDGLGGVKLKISVQEAVGPVITIP